MEASLIAKYFLYKASLSEDSGISNLKLQKLLYYAQGFYLAFHKEPLFNDKIEAWQHGPVCPEIYHAYKTHGSNIIPYSNETNFSELLTPEQINFLDEVYDEFAQFSAWKLRNMTHDEPTWINHELTASEIPVDEIRDYFLTRI
ncbi:Panacea domain-containing protein [Aliarcobacter butzleri]|uniref:Panacea domain-containing protein n=1 Tax=Aliarcobacter butzleri TaxID=28197 RepID=UPI00263F4317|nr:type II toxin-antitoxin system antitoxin SocA domain-containing protein [Aliarcobacter butzleri]MDN5095060.1 DUF4065 domain-containing protein [Aliarcobacter butzleri]